MTQNKTFACPTCNTSCSPVWINFGKTKIFQCTNFYCADLGKVVRGQIPSIKRKDLGYSITYGKGMRDLGK